MSVKSVKDAVGQWRNNTPFPKDRYVLHCVEEVFGESGSKNLMLTRTWEIVSPEVITVGDRNLQVAGQQIVEYVVTKNSDGEGGWDEKKSSSSFGRATEDFKILGFAEDSWDDENPPKLAKGKTIDGIVYAEETVQRKSPTPEQLSKGIKMGDPIKDASGKDVKAYQLKLGTKLGISASVKINTAF